MPAQSVGEEGFDVSGETPTHLAWAGMIFVVAGIGGLQAVSRLMADCVLLSSSAARVKLFCSATKTEAWTASRSEGIGSQASGQYAHDTDLHRIATV